MSRRTERLAERYTLRVAHDIPGRLRLRLPADARGAGLEEAVRGTEGVLGASWTPRTRSLLVHYRPEATAPETILDAVGRHAGVHERMVDPGADRPDPPPPQSLVVSAVHELFGELNERVWRATRQTLGLGTAMPVALTAWAVLEVLRGRAAPLAWSSALWYAHGLFRDYNATPPAGGG